MHIEGLLWIADALGVELPEDYYSAMTDWPFLSHEGSTELLVWDDEQAIISATQAHRAGAEGQPGWASHWVQIGAAPEGPLVLDCRNGAVRIALDGDVERVGQRWSGPRGVFATVHDGYRGELPSGWGRKDSSFAWFDALKELPWTPPYGDNCVHPFADERALRIDQACAESLARALAARGFSVLRIDGRRMADADAFFDELARSVHPELPGAVDGWPDYERHLAERLRTTAAGGVHQAAILWEHADVTLRENPNQAVDGAITLTSLYTWIFEETGTTVRTFFCGAPSAGFTVRLGSNPPPAP